MLRTFQMALVYYVIGESELLHLGGANGMVLALSQKEHKEWILDIFIIFFVRYPSFYCICSGYSLESH